MSKGFKYLDDLIHSGELEILLDFDIILDEENELNYVHGIRIDVDDILIDGGGHFIDARHLTRIFFITGRNVVLVNIQLLNGYSFSRSGDEESDGNFRNPVLPTGYGGAIYNRGEVTLINCSFMNNHSLSFGGAIANTSNYSLKLEMCSFTENSAYNGGAIFNRGDLEMSECKFHNNGGPVMIMSYHCLRQLDGKSTKYGGAILNEGQLKILNSEFLRNYARDGGAINNYGGEIMASGLEFFKNASRLSGAINNWEGKIRIENTEFTQNVSKIRWNPDYACSGKYVEMMEKIETNNETVTGAIFNRGCIELSGCSFKGNDGNVNSIYNTEGNKCVVENSRFDGDFKREVKNLGDVFNSKFKGQ